MRQVILVRHTETELIASGNNGAKRNDSPLSEFGKKQAEEIKEFIKSKKYNFQVVFTSLFQRALDTGKIISIINNSQVVPTSSFNEYFVRDDHSGVESTEAGAARTMAKIYSLSDVFNEIVLVGHASINKTILQSFTNMEFSQTENYFNKLGEVHILRYDWKKGDQNWKILDSFIPKQD